MAKDDNVKTTSLDDTLLAALKENLPQMTCEAVSNRLLAAVRFEEIIREQQELLEAADDRIKHLKSDLEHSRKVNKSLEGKIKQVEQKLRSQEQLDAQKIEQQHQRDLLKEKEDHLKEMKEWTKEMYTLPFQNRQFREQMIRDHGDTRGGKTETARIVEES